MVSIFLEQGLVDVDQGHCEVLVCWMDNGVAIHVFSGGAEQLLDVVESVDRNLVAFLVVFPHMGGAGLDKGSESWLDDGFV